MTDQIAKRLIHAAKLPYFISFEPPYQFSPDEGMEKFHIDFMAKAALSSPSAAIHDESGENACLIADFVNPVTNANDIVVSFRGTHPPAITNNSDVLQFIKDWEIDFKLEQKPCNFAKGLVHIGYQTAITNLWDAVYKELTSRLAARAGANIYVTGHSKGGALAFLAAYRIAHEINQKPIVYSFAAARVGNGEFKEAYQTLVPDTFRYEYADDFVPHFPLQYQFSISALGLLTNLSAMLDITDGALDSLLHRGYLSVDEIKNFLQQDMPYKYESVGLLRYIAADNTITQYANDKLIAVERVKSLLKLMFTGQVLTIAEDHSIDPTLDNSTTLRKYGYYPAVVA